MTKFFFEQSKQSPELRSSTRWHWLKICGRVRLVGTHSRTLGHPIWVWGINFPVRANSLLFGNFIVYNDTLAAVASNIVFQKKRNLGQVHISTTIEDVMVQLILINCICWL